MCGLHAYDKNNDRSTDATNFGGGRPLPEDSTMDPLIFFLFSIEFIDTCFNALEESFSWSCCDCKEKTK